MHPFTIGSIVVKDTLKGKISGILQPDYVVVDFTDGTIEVLHINDIQLADDKKVEEVHSDWDWSMPFAPGQRVTLNPHYREYWVFKELTDNSNGTIVEIRNEILNKWHEHNTIHRLVRVTWDNEHSDYFPICSLLPVGNIVYNPNKLNFETGMKICIADSITGYVIRNHKYTLEYVMQDYITTSYINKVFVQIIDKTPRKIQKVHINGIGVYYVIERTNSVAIADNLIITGNHTALSMEDIN